MPYIYLILEHIQISKKCAEGERNMKKVFRALIAGLLTMSMLVGCSSAGGGTTTKTKDTPAQTKEQAPKEEKQEPAPVPTNDSKTVTVYSPHPADPLNAGIKAFQEETGITVNMVAAGTGELLKRIEAESANPLCDVLWGGGAESLAAYVQYFEEYVSSTDSVIAPNNKDAAHKWTGESPLPMVIMYNKKLVSEEEVPTGWVDLLDSKWKGKIAYADPAKSGSSFTILATMVTAFGKDDGKGWDFVRELVANLDGKVLGSSSGVYKGVADGEYSLGLTLEKSAQEYVKAGADVGYIYPKEGTSAVPDGVALVKGGPNQENAKLFIDYVLGSENQQMMADQYNRRPVRTDLNPPEGLTLMEDIPLVDYDFEWASTQKQEILKQWKDIVVGK